MSNNGFSLFNFNGTDNESTDKKTEQENGFNLFDFSQDTKASEPDNLVSPSVKIRNPIDSDNPEAMLSASKYASPEDILGAQGLSFFDKTEEKGVQELSELFPNFIFEQKTFQSKKGGGLDAITVYTKNEDGSKGDKSASFDMAIGNPLAINLYGGAATSVEEGRNNSFDILTKFINENSEQKDFDAADAAKVKRQKVYTETNKKRDALAAEEVKDIETRFNDGSLFEPKETKVKSFRGFGMETKFGIGTPEYTKTEQPYEAELEQARKELKKELDAQPTADQIRARAKEIIIDGIQEEKLTEIIESNDYQYKSVEFLGGVGLTKRGKEASKAQQYNIAAKEFQIDFLKDLESKELKETELTSGTEVTRLREINNIIEDEKLSFEFLETDTPITLKNGKKIPERVLNEYIGLNQKVNNKVKAYLDFSEKVQEKAADYSDNIAAQDISRRNYNGVEEFLVETALGAGELLINYSAGMNLAFGGYNENLIKDVGGIKNKIQEVRDSYSKDVEFKDAFKSIGNFASFAMQETSNQIPIFAALAAPGGLAAIGFGSFNDQYINLAQERDTPGGRQKSDANIWWSSLGFGTSEVIFQGLTTLPLIRAAKRGFTGTPEGKTLFDMTAGKYFKKNIGLVGYGAVSEPVGEGLTQVSQNLIDGRPITENLDHAMFSGLMFGTTLASAPFLRGVYLAKFNDHVAMKDVRKRLNTIKDLHAININAKINIKAGDKSVTLEDIKNNEKIITDLQAENVAEMKEVQKNMQGTSNDALKFYFALDTELENIKNEAQAVANNKSLNDKTKADRLETLQTKFDFIQGKQDIFRDKKAFGDEWTAYSGVTANKENVDKIINKAKNELVKEGKKDPTDIEINDKAKFIYNVDKINADHAANSRKGLTDVINAQTKQEAIDKINKLTNVTDANKQKAIKGIEQGNHGVNMPTTDGNNIPMQVVESMAADDRLETRTHEVGHSVFIKAISSDPKAFNGLANQVLEYLKENNPSAYKRVGFRLGGQTNADEVIMVFLEEVAAKKIDVAKTEKAGLFATLMNKGVEDVGGKPIDLKGETDAINFLIGIAKKIKDGSINQADIKAIRSNIIAKKARARVEQAKTDEVKMSQKPLDAIKALVPKTVKTQEDYYALLNDPRIAKKAGIERIFDGRNLAPVIEAYIRSRSTSLDMANENIKEVKKRLANFDPAATREDGSIVGPESFGEFIFANARFGKMVAEKKLAIKAKEQKRTTRIDDPDVKDIPDDKPTPTPETEQKQPKIRKLKEFDVELSNPEFISALTMTTVNDLLNDLNTGKITFDQAVVRMEKLVLKDIRSELSNSIPKIAKNPETGKREPTPEYEAFIRDEYDEIVPSLGIATIRKAYKKWFKQEKTGKKDYKNIDPVTGDVSNFVKDTQINTTNKREYIRWFLEGKPGDLTERRTALIRRISKRKVSLAIDNYIEENSNNLGDKMKAKMRTMSDSAQNAINEQVSFDHVKFSEVMYRKVGNINAQMGRLKKPINGLTHYYKPPNWKKGDKVLTFSYNIKTGKWNEGFVYEQAFAETLQEISSNIENFMVTLEVAGEEGGRADAQVSYLGEIENHEIKKSLSAFFGSTLINNLNIENKSFTIVNDVHNNIKSRDGKTTLKSFVENVIIPNLKEKIKVINNEIDIYNNKYGYKKGDVEFAEKITGDVAPRKPESIPLEVYDKVGKELGVLKTGVEIIQNHYATKEAGKVKSISIFGYGAFRIDPTSIFKGLPMLDVATEVYASLRYGKRETRGSKDFVTFKTGLQFRLDKSVNKGQPNNESNSGLVTEQSILEALGSPAIFSKNISKTKTLDTAVKASRVTKPSKGITVLDFDDTLATTESLVKFTAPDGTTGTLNAEQFASTYQDLQDQGYTFDFSDFNKVVKGKLAPLFQKALKLQNKFGPENMFVLTARPPAAQKPIFDFLKANGLNIPLKNITGLGNSTSEAKALWIADKVADGYNDFYFADDALQNVQAVDNVLSQFDVKRKIQQAKVKFSLSTKQNLNWKEDGIGYMTTNFDVDGKNYKITLYPTDLNDTNYELEFDLVTDKGLTQEMTGTGSQFKVLGTVYNGLLDVIKQKPNIETIGFSSLTKDKSRARVYTVLMDRLGKKLGWKTDIYEYGSGTQLDFEVAKPKTRKARTKTTESIRNIPAVKNMLNQSDVKSPTQQAKVKFSESLNNDFNKILEQVTGIEANKRFSDTKARKRGADKGKFRFFIPPSHEDFIGLLYNFMGKGRQGDAHRDFFEQALVRPLNRAYREIDTAKQAIANDYKSLNKQFPDVKKKLIKTTPDGDFTFQDAIRVYLWNKHGYTIPGLSKTDQANLVEIVMNDVDLLSYAEGINTISRQDTYVDPGQNWETGNIRIDLVDATGRVGRAEYFAEFNENADIMFSPENLNKIEAAYGKGVREALEDMLHRIKTGVNRPKGASAKPNMLLNWLNASVSGVMFFNTRSALLQQMSNVNYLNFADNNIYAAGKAFANQKQYWQDFAMIFNSDMLKQRRGGLQTDINGAELAEAIKKARPGNMFDQVAIITGKALRLGFLPTQIGDNIAIATGGAAFYRNRVNKYIKDGLSKKEAEDKAFTDLQDITNATQQSARPDMTSQQQAAVIGKIVLNFLNTPSQYNRIIKKAGSDIINRRITPPNTTQLQSDMSNMSRILYYGAAQNLIFYSLQTALFAVMFGLDDEDEQEKAEQFLKKKERVIQGSIDTILRGSGIYGVAISTIKNMVRKFLEQREKGYNKDESAVIMEMLNFSPVVGIKARKIVNAEKTLNYNKDIIKEMETFDIDNPMWSAVTNYVEVAGPPVNRIYQKTINLRNAMDNQYSAFERAMFFSGYTTWSLGLGDTQKMKDVKQKVKDKKKEERKKKKRKKVTFDRIQF